MTTKVLVRNVSSFEQPPREITVKESQAGGPETKILKTGQEGEFEVHGSSAITIREN